MTRRAGCSHRGADPSKTRRGLCPAVLPSSFRDMWRRWRNAGEEGSSLVEFGLVVPMLLLTLTGIFSFGIIFNQYQMLTNAANSAARYFAASRDSKSNNTLAPGGDACAYAATIVQQDSPNLTSSNLSYKIVYTVSATKTATTYSGSSPSCSGLVMTEGDTVQVTATYPVTAFLFSMASRNMTLSGSSTELVQ